MDEAAGSGGWLRGMVSPSARTTQLAIGLAVVAALFLLLALLARHVFTQSANYYQRRDLRMLERVGQDITSGIDGLTIAASLHFDARKMIFTLAPGTRCLVGTVKVPTGRAGQMSIDYFFVDPDRTTRWLSRLAAEDDLVLGSVDPKASPPKAGTIEPPFARMPGADRCTMERPLGEPNTPTISIGSTLSVERNFPINRLIGTSVYRGSASAGEESTVAGVETMLAGTAAKKLKQEPVNLIRDGDGAAPNLDQLARDSIRTAFASNVVHVRARRPAGEIGESAHDASFAAIKLLHMPSDAAKPPDVLWQVGAVPPLLDHSTTDAVDRLVLNFLGAPQTPPAAGAATKNPANDNRLASPSASVSRVGNLVVYQRDYIGPEGIDCTATRPCKLVAAREAADVDAEARHIDGVRATWLLIIILSVMAVLPLIQLTLSKRLDPIGRASQYLLWLSLGFLAANAVITALTILATSANLTEGDQVAAREADRIRGDFTDEMARTVQAATTIGQRLACFVPETAHAFPLPLDVRPKPVWSAANAMVIETELLFDADQGQSVGDRLRWNRLIAPSFGASVADRDYFQAARSGEYHRVSWQPGGLPYAPAQVFSKPDGVRKTVIATPATCATDRSKRYVAVTTGYLRTFLLRALPVGLSYAVVDYARTKGPDVIFHTDRSSEQIDRFTDDIDDPNIVGQAITHATDTLSQPITTRYRAHPVRLRMVRLAPDLDWVLVMIEDRDQSGYGIWRNAVAGYAAWTFAVLLAGAAGLAFRASRPRGLDRKPSMWLWPHRVLCSWAPQFESDVVKRQQILAARRAFNARVTIAACYILAIVVTPEPARLFMALTTVALTMSARAAFKGQLGSVLADALWVDRWTIRLGIATATLTILANVAILTTDVRFAIGDTGPHGGGIYHALDKLRMARALLSGGLALLAIQVLRRKTTRPHPALSGSADGKRSVGAAARRLVERHGLRLDLMVRRLSWTVALTTAAIAPSTAGFLDSYAANAAWSRQVNTAAQCEFAHEVTANIAAINRTLLTGFGPRDLKGNESIPVACAKKASSAEVTWLTVGVSRLGLQPKALRYSHSLPSYWHWPSVDAALGATLPFLALMGAFALFRREFFRKGPAAAVGTPGLDSANLTASLIKVAKHAHGLAGTGTIEAPARPFALSFAQRHLIVGAAPYHLEDPRLQPPVSRVARYNLLDDGAVIANPKDVGAVLIYNFDAALLRAGTCRVALDRLEALVDQQRTPEGRHLHLFIFASSQPLDRILATEVLRDADEPTPSPPPSPPLKDCIPDELRWAELFDSFPLYTVAPPPRAAGATLFQRELTPVGTRAAQMMLAQEGEWKSVHERDLIAFLTDFLADHYSFIWETSSPDERVILYEIARESHLKMRNSFALRSLMLRRLVVRSPEYRLMNESFSIYVRNVGKPSTLRDAAIAAKDGKDTIWPILRLPLALLVASGLALLILVTPGEGGFTTMVPALAAAVPALVSAWLRGSRPVTS